MRVMAICMLVLLTGCSISPKPVTTPPPAPNITPPSPTAMADCEVPLRRTPPLISSCRKIELRPTNSADASRRKLLPGHIARGRPVALRGFECRLLRPERVKFSRATVSAMALVYAVCISTLSIADGRYDVVVLRYEPSARFSGKCWGASHHAQKSTDHRQRAQVRHCSWFTQTRPSTC